MRYVLEVVPLTDPVVRLEFRDKRKAAKAFLEQTRLVKRKKIWGVRILLFYGTGRYDYWLIVDCYQEPIKGRGLNDLPPTALLASIPRASRSKVPHAKGTGKPRGNRVVRRRKGTKAR